MRTLFEYYYLVDEKNHSRLVYDGSYNAFGQTIYSNFYSVHN
jgi:hypothetical protein